jgi:ABC-type Zn uptake system ZnuABC Zn-binding protein ZnuA
LHDSEIDLCQEVSFATMRATSILAFVSSLCLSLAAMALPGQAYAAAPEIVTTTMDLKGLVESIAGSAVHVEALLAPSQDPHTAEIRPAQLARLRRAALIVRIGLDHEPWFARLNLPPGTPVLDASRGVALLQTETPRLRVERQVHVHAFGNTHYWLDPENAWPMTADIVEALSRLLPDERALFEMRRKDFLVQLASRLQTWENTLAPNRGTQVVVTHDTWAYFANRFKLSIVAAAEPTPGVPPSPAELAALLRRMREAKVKLVIADPYSNQALVQQIASHSGARVVTLVPSIGADPAAVDYLSLFEVNVRRLADALR